MNDLTKHLLDTANAMHNAKRMELRGTHEVGIPPCQAPPEEKIVEPGANQRAVFRVPVDDLDGEDLIECPICGAGTSVYRSSGGGNYYSGPPWVEFTDEPGCSHYDCIDKGEAVFCE